MAIKTSLTRLAQYFSYLIRLIVKGKTDFISKSGLWETVLAFIFYMGESELRALSASEKQGAGGTAVLTELLALRLETWD